MLLKLDNISNCAGYKLSLFWLNCRRLCVELIRNCKETRNCDKVFDVKCSISMRTKSKNKSAPTVPKYESLQASQSAPQLEEIGIQSISSHVIHRIGFISTFSFKILGHIPYSSIRQVCSYFTLLFFHILKLCSEVEFILLQNHWQKSFSLSGRTMFRPILKAIWLGN